jgi:hypothetical protein
MVIEVVEGGRGNPSRVAAR